MAMSSTVTKIETRRMDNTKRLASDSTVRLEAESQRMEERLSVLRKIMSAEKSRREEAGGIHWQKGQKGPLHRRPALPPHAPPPGASRGQKGGEGTSKKPLRIRILTDRNKGAKGSSRLPSCGQCDKSTASLSCLECVENYCTVCFAKFHQKGALSRHHVKPMVNKPPVNPPGHNGVSAGTNTGSLGATLPKTTSILSAARNSKESSTSTSTAADSQTASTATATDFSTQYDEAGPGWTGIIKTNHGSPYEGISAKSASGGGSLLEGTYDEAEAAASFQEALAEWRTGGGAHRTSGGVHRTREKGENTVAMRDSSCSTQSTQSSQSSQSTPAATTDPHGLRVEFSSKTGVSYFERLMVRRHRVETVFRKASKGPGCLSVAPKLCLESETSREESALESVPSQYNLFYSTEEVEGGACEMTSSTDYLFERPSSSVVIEEMGFTIEETEPKVKASLPEHTKRNGKPPPPTVTNSKVLLPNEPDSRKKKPHSAKRQVVIKRSSLMTKVSDAVPIQKPNPSVSRGGEMTAETDIATSVRSAWADSGRWPHQSESTDASILSTFFLSGVQRSDQPPTTSPKSDETAAQAHSEGRFRFASTIWLPDSSSVVTYSDQRESLSHPTTLQPVVPVHTPDNHYRNKEQDSDFDINTDLPPPTIASPAASDIDGSRIPTRQDTASSCNYYYDSDSSSSESCDNLSLFDIEEAELEELQQLQDWEERADSETLESLTSELGRITRCQGEVEESRGDYHFEGLAQDHREVAGVSQGMCGGGDEITVGGHSVDVERVMSEFELYHQQLMEDSDQD